MNAEKTQLDFASNDGVRPAQAHWAMIIGVAFLLCAPAAIARQAGYRFCFPSNTTFGTPVPVIDGDIINDPGWARAPQYVAGGGAGSPDIVVRGIRGFDSNGVDSIYLAIEANKLDTLATSGQAASSLVVVAIDPDGTAVNMRRIHVYPVISGATEGQGFSVESFEYWGKGMTDTTSTATWVGPPATGFPTPLPDWLGPNNDKLGYHKDPVDGTWHWYLEMKIPVIDPAGLTLFPTNAPFGLYIEVFRVINMKFWPTSWPTGQTQCQGQIVGTCTADSPTPLPATWGTPALNCSGGVSITTGDYVNGSFIYNIFTDNFPDSKISLDLANNFHAYIQNTTVDASNSGLPAKQIKATFRIANWGLGTPQFPDLKPWDPVTTDPVPSNNPTALSDIPGSVCQSSTNNGNGACHLGIGPWTLPLHPGQQNAYANANQRHQCIRVELESNDPGTIILNRVAQRNMDFDYGSRFERMAEINAKGYPPRLNANGTSASDQLFDLRIITHEEVLKPAAIGPLNSRLPSTGDQTQGSTLNQDREQRSLVVSQVTWIAEGCRHTGRYMTIKNQTLELCDPVGAFGYVIRHVGNTPVRKWKVKVTGAKLGQPTNNVYPIHVPQDGVENVTTTIEPKEMNLAVFLDAGPNIPHGTFGKAFNKGFSLNAGLEYIANTHVSAEGIFGYHHFPAKVAGDLNIYQFSANAKVYLIPRRKVGKVVIQPFVKGGPGLYKLSPGPSKFGGNVGFGGLLELTPRFGLQASYNLHAVNTSGGATKFSTLQGGIRYVF